MSVEEVEYERTDDGDIIDPVTKKPFLAVGGYDWRDPEEALEEFQKVLDAHGLKFKVISIDAGDTYMFGLRAVED